MINWRTYTDDNGAIIFEDETDRCEISEYVDAESITYDERAGYILSDGRNLTDIIIEK